MALAAGTGFRWGSMFGISAIVLLVYGALNILFATFVPLLLHFGGIAGAPGLVMSAMADAALLGRSLADVQKSDPRLATYLVTFMDTMCMMMMGLGLAQVGLAWFGMRRVIPWTFWTLVVTNLAFVPYAIAITSTFSSFGVSMNLGDLFFFVVFPLPLIPAIVLGWMGLQQRPQAPATG